ncbi:MAG TPA: quaternary ammonium compound efflux SMR transporter SugE [Verrucomicrobiae bacterium]|nr:quaternary ammonium compound efflux SMR transporter SugE [Verrucomicrobiae bacterium]
MSWFYLILAGLLEVAWTIGLKLSQGFTRPLASIVTVALMIASFTLLSFAMRVLPLGTAYAVWTGIGAVGAALAGMILFDEPRTATRLFCVALIVAGIAGLKFTTARG